MKSLSFFSLFSLLFLIAPISANSLDASFFVQTDAFLKKNVENGFVHYEKLNGDRELEVLIGMIREADLAESSDLEKQAFYINAYNLLVIKAVVSEYPIGSVQEVAGFFDRKKFSVAGNEITLNQLEKQYLIKTYGDARFHFVLVCGAIDCPPITNFAYLPERLEEQLDRQTALSLNNPDFIKTNESEISLSQIFNWYSEDFGGSNKSVVEFINAYRTDKLSESAKINFYEYDWSLNDSKISLENGTQDSNTGTTRYIVSSTIKKGSIETKLFNNLYTQRTGDGNELFNRSTFFTTSLSVLYGLTDRFNVGLITRYRRVRNDFLPSNVLAVFGNNLETGESNRHGITAIGPQVRIAPIPSLKNFSIQSSFAFPIGSDLAGSATEPFIDWTGPTWNTQLLNDFTFNRYLSLFTEVDLLLEDIGSDKSNRFSTPATLIFSYNPSSDITLYSLGSFSPYWQETFDYFFQFGLGGKYQFTQNLELELLYTDFSNKFLIENNGQAATYNLGLRFNL